VARPPEFRPRPILDALIAHRVDFVVIGGIAGVLRGSSYPTYDLDVAYARNAENLERLASALLQLRATLRGAPPDLPFTLDAKTLENGAHFTFDTPYGSVDILTDPDGAPKYDELKSAAGAPQPLEGVLVYAASLDHLIGMKEAAGRTKDKLMASEYRMLADEIRKL
jgi:hypothetical protein